MMLREEQPTRPVLRYHGGKWRLARWILGFFPSHRIYAEPFGGAASILVQKTRSYAEVYNDIDREVVNVFAVLRDPLRAVRLQQLLELTPFSRAEFENAYVVSDDPIEQARRTIIKAFAGFGSGASHDQRAHGMRTRRSIHRPPTSFRSNSKRNGTTPAHDWATYPQQIDSYVARLQGVVIECTTAARIIEQHDSRETLFYVDPPYPLGTRSAIRRRGGKMYAHELSDSDHRELATHLHSVVGMVVLSGYGCEFYDVDLYRGWSRYEIPHFADGARPRVEVVWLNPACASALEREQDQMELAL